MTHGSIIARSYVLLSAQAKQYIHMFKILYEQCLDIFGYFLNVYKHLQHVYTKYTMYRHVMDMF